ncbi:hypothetical protein [Micromonospora sp. NPDC051141]|uniref:hypothetical protein n=1 Tax=Micromonospora sp. NPDC051141 TaxID=3364284 RepID=UPI0037A29A1A
MTGVTEHEIESPCGWCGNAIVQPPTGRKKRYCDRSCRQRAYELRSAQQRHQADVDAGRIRTVPAQRVVERIVQARHPVTTSGWEQALAVLATQLRSGRIGGWDHDRIRGALNEVLAALADRPTAPPAGPAGAVVEQLLARTGPTGLPRTTVARLADTMAATPAVVRQALNWVTRSHRAHLTRAGEHVDVAALADHDRFHLLPGPPV